MPFTVRCKNRSTIRRSYNPEAEGERNKVVLILLLAGGSVTSQSFKTKPKAFL